MAQSVTFRPDEIEAMHQAFDTVCAKLGLSTAGDRVTEMVAQKVLEIAATGVRDPEELAERALAYFQDPVGAA